MCIPRLAVDVKKQCMSISVALTSYLRSSIADRVECLKRAVIHKLANTQTLSNDIRS